MKCFYHSADLDGHCSGAIVKYRFPEAKMYPINYGDEFPWDKINKNDVVYVVDFCLQPFYRMIRLAKGCGLYWLDHHKSAHDEYKANVEAFREEDMVIDESKAACELTWEYLFPDRPVPLAVKLLSLYDSWTYQGHELEPMVLPFQMRMRMEDLDPKDWEECGWAWRRLFKDPDALPGGLWQSDAQIEQYIEEGKLLLRYDEEQKRRYVATYGFETKLTDPDPDSCHPYYFTAIAINLGHTNSKVFDSVWRKVCNFCNDGGKHGCYPVGHPNQGLFGHTCHKCRGTGYIEPYDLMITFVRRTDRKWNVSLYSTKPDIDCGAIAKTFGGGGHKGAAGFQCDELPFDH